MQRFKLTVLSLSLLSILCLQSAYGATEAPLKQIFATPVPEEQQAEGFKLPDNLTEREKKELAELESDASLTPAQKAHIRAFWLKHRTPTGGLSKEAQQLAEQDPHLPREQTAPRKNIFDKAFLDAERAQSSLASLLGIELPGHKNPSPQEVKEDLEKLRHMFQVTAPIKVNMLFAVEATPGNMMFFTENGRFFFKGTMYDAFNGLKPLKNIDDIVNYALKTDYKKMQLDPESLSSARIGDGPRQVVIYVDPAAPHTKELIDLVLKYPQQDMFTFYFVVLPSDSEESKELAKIFYCARQQNNPEIGNMLYKGTLNKLGTGQCKMDNWQNTITAAYYTQVDVLPFFVGDDGRISRGVPSEGFYNWLSAQSMANLDDAFKTDRQLEMQRRTEVNLNQQILKQEATFEEARKAQKEFKAPTKVLKTEQEEEEYLSLDDYIPTDSNVTSEQGFGVRSEEWANGTVETTRPLNPEYHPSNLPERPRARKSTDKGPANGGVMRNQHSEKDLLNSGEIVKDPTQTVDTTGFDPADMIERYYAEAAQNSNENLVVNGLDQSAAMEVAGDLRATADTLSEFSTGEFQDTELTTADLRRKDKNILEEISGLKQHVRRIQNEFRQQREDERRKFEKEWDSYETALVATRNYGESRKQRRQQEIRERQEKIRDRYYDKLDDLDRQEQEALRDTVEEIHFLEQGLIQKK